MNKLLAFIKTQLPTAKLHGLGSSALLVALGLLGYFEYAGDHASAAIVLATVLGLLMPAPVRTNNAPGDDQ